TRRSSDLATDSLDPGSWTNQVPYTFGRFWGEQLLDIRPDGGIEPKLAEEYDSSPDAKVWTFKIRKGVTFHNGKELTSEDVVATVERHGDANSKSVALTFLS